MGLALNWLAAGLLAFASAFYVLVYTMWLKRRTPQNIVIGGAAGAFPPMIGWAAATGEVGIEALVLFLIIFAWTPSRISGRFRFIARGITQRPVCPCYRSLPACRPLGVIFSATP